MRWLGGGLGGDAGFVDGVDEDSHFLQMLGNLNVMHPGALEVEHDLAFHGGVDRVA